MKSSAPIGGQNSTALSFLRCPPDFSLTKAARAIKVPLLKRDVVAIGLVRRTSLHVGSHNTDNPPSTVAVLSGLVLSKVSPPSAPFPEADDGGCDRQQE
jgi:hypothetical protein